LVLHRSPAAEAVHFTTNRTHGYLGLAGVAVKTMRNWRVQGLGPPFVATGRKLVRYRPSDLRAYQETNLRRSTSGARDTLIPKNGREGH
jgi:hypothetical protein